MLSSLVHRAIHCLLPERVRLRWLPTILAVFNPERRWPRLRITRTDDRMYYLLDRNTGRGLYFYEQKRIRRYAWPEGLQARLDMMRAKYESDAVRVKPGDVVLDIGANIGEFSIAVSEQASVVIAVEPDPVAFACLERNSAAYDGVRALQKLVGERDGDEVTFYLASETADSSLIEPTDTKVERVVMRTMTLDGLLAQEGVQRVDFLKLEAEGAEPEILRGAMQTLAQVSRVTVDAGPERAGEPTVEPVRGLLAEAGFEVSVDENHIVRGWRAER